MNNYSTRGDYVTDPEATPATAHVKETYNVCGQGYYVQPAGWRMNHIDDGSDGWGCHVCPTPMPTNSQSPTYQGLPEPYPEFTDLQNMCDPDPDVWFSVQRSNDIQGDENAMTGERRTWENVKNVLDTGQGEPNALNIAAKWWTEKLTPDELEQRRQHINYRGTVDEMIQEVQQFTQPSPPCTIPDNQTPLGQLLLDEQGEPNFSSPSCANGYISSIITDQFEPWSLQYQNTNPVSDVPSTEFDFSVFQQTIGPPNDNFEECINMIVSDGNEYDTEQINQLKMTSWKHYTEDNIMFIRRKLQVFLDTSNDERIMNCMGNYLYLDDSICKVGLTQHMTKIAEVLFFIIGYDPTFTITNENDRRQLEQLIQSLGNYVPRVLDRIIEISDMYETQYCRGETSQATHVLRTAYDNMFKVEKPIVSFTNPFSSLVSEETSDTEFQRTSILVTLGIAFLKYF